MQRRADKFESADYWACRIAKSLILMVVRAVTCEPVSPGFRLRTGIFCKIRQITGFWPVDAARLPEIPPRSPKVTGGLSHFPVILQNRRLKRKNRRCKAQHQAFVPAKQVTESGKPQTMMLSRLSRRSDSP
jgi:hypothetical protein